MVFNFIIFFIGFFIGVLVYKYFLKYIAKKSEESLINNINSFFKRVLDVIDSGDAVYLNRINNNVTITANFEDLGLINIMYLMDKKDIAIFKDDTCIYTSHLVKKDIIESIIKKIDILYSTEIDDIVNVMGLIYYRVDFEKKFNIKVDDLKKNMFGTKDDDVSDVDKIIKNNKSKFSIDNILDRITLVGINNLTDAEKKFLENYNR